jgi:S-formylglutathione hydrolase FrmB
MKRSIYETTYYDETTNKWSGMPGGQYFGEILISYLQKTFALAYDRNKTGIMGIGTGGRGAILMAATYPQYFSAAAGLSGDYSPEDMPHNRLLRSVYGEYRRFPERWKNDDNPLNMAENLKDVRVFLAHGGRDRRVSPTQTQIMLIRLNMLYRSDTINHRPIVQNFPSLTHDWIFWRTVLPHAMAFFNEGLE